MNQVYIQLANSRTGKGDRVGPFDSVHLFDRHGWPVAVVANDADGYDHLIFAVWEARGWVLDNDSSEWTDLVISTEEE